MTAETDLQFDGWRVNRVSGEISREGRASRLQQQPLRILVQLYDHAGGIVTREQLVKILWPAGIVDFDNGLNVAMRKLRVALDDVGDTPRYIETLPKVGYRFLAKPGAVATAPVPSASAAKAPKRARTFALLALATVVFVGIAWWWFTGFSLAKSKHEPSLRAQELYLQGIHERSRRDVNPTEPALRLFEAALKEDPLYPAAWSAYGFTLGGAVMRQMSPPREVVPKIRVAAERAIALDPDFGDGHVLMTHVLMDHEKNFAAAAESLDRARATGQLTGRFWHYSAVMNGQLGHVDAALADMRKARELEPMTLLYTSNYALILVNARRNQEVIELLKPVVEANPKFDLARGYLARALMETGDLEGAREQLEAREEIGLLQAELALVYLKLGQRDRALQELVRIAANGRKGFGVGYYEATIYTAL
ncbi:MAG TPA: winged helix-turn-helix domain-containing protein, partial [Vicinamibacterales bacterium]|nr:winged helix-turn-helix domain-containing protein [Vicinamibacterales bacterium]